MKIEITGIRNEGKTTAAVHIIRALRDAGASVAYRGVGDHARKCVEDSAAERPTQDLLEAKIEVIDICCKE